METRVFAQIERYQPDEPVHVNVFNGERTKVLLLCLAPGLTVPPHTHPGFEVTRQPLRGTAALAMADGSDLVLEPGRIHFVDGAESFSSRNPHTEPFQMLIHLIRK